MKRISIAIAVFIFSTASFADTDCANALTNDALVVCSKQVLLDSENNYKSSLNKLSKSPWIPKKSISSLLAYYERSSALSKTVCTSVFHNGRLRDMYINDCVSTQLDKLVDSMKSYICTQQDADGCQ